MDFRGWTFPASDSMYTAANHHSPFATNVSSFFRRPSKIVKPNSRNTSPKHNGRRRTTSNAQLSRTKSLLDKQRSSLQQQFNAQQQTRPLSWHPNSYPDFTYQSQQMPVDVSYSSYPQYMYPTTAVNGLVTPMTYPLPDEPQIQELITPLEDLSAQEGGSNYDASGYGYQYWMDSDMGKDQVYVMDDMFPQQQVVQQAWLYQHPAMLDIPTAPPSPAFLPIQGAIEASPLSLDTRQLPSHLEGEELVGMGLYDSPAEVQHSSLLFGGGFSGVARKRSLKLEESFEPAPEKHEDEEADETEDEDAEEESEDNEPELPIQQNKPVQPARSTSSMIGQSFFFDAEADANAAQYATNMAHIQSAGYQTQYPAGYGWV